MSLCSGFAPNRVAGISSKIHSCINLTLTGICIWQEAISDSFNGIFNRFRPVFVFNRFFFVGAQVRQIALLLLNLDGGGHVGAKPLAELCEIDVAVLVHVKDVFHNCLDLFLSCINLYLFQVPFEVFIANETISIHIEGFKQAICRWFCGV